MSIFMTSLPQRVNLMQCGEVKCSKDYFNHYI